MDRGALGPSDGDAAVSNKKHTVRAVRRRLYLKGRYHFMRVVDIKQSSGNLIVYTRRSGAMN